MKYVRRFFGALVMIAGILGLLISLAGLAVVWVGKATVATTATSTIDTLSRAIVTSQGVMDTTTDALGATVDSVDALSEMLGTTASTLDDTKPILDSVDRMLAITLPDAVQTAADSLSTAQQAAQVLEGTMKSLETFQVILSATPFVGDLLPKSTATYSPEKPFAESLGDLAASLEGLPDTFTSISANLGTTGQKLDSVEGNLLTMSDSVKLISSSLSEYKTMVGESRSSMGSLAAILTNVQKNLATILNWAAIALTLFFAWLLAAQVVILSQGWEINHGTADRMEK